MVGRGLLPPPRGVGSENFLDFITHSAEFTEDFLVAACCVGWIIKTPMVTIALSGILGAYLIGIPAHRYHRVDFLSQKFIHVFAMVRAQIDADFLHHLDG